jgi:hypothetical protein
MEYITEAEALADIEESRTCYDDDCDYEDFKQDREHSIKSDYKHYIKNKQAKVGTKIQCAENRCRNVFIKKSYQQAFCCTKHKNQFWNRQRLQN